MPKTKQLSETGSEVKVKKPFDKARWREKKYSKKFKIQQWEERRQKAALHHYYKGLRKEDPTFRRPDLSKKKATGNAREERGKPTNAYQQALQEYHKKQIEKEKRQQEIEKQTAERKEALNQYKIKKAERFKKLSKKTKKGQPVMKDRIELLLEKIQRDIQPQTMSSS